MRNANSNFFFYNQFKRFGLCHFPLLWSFTATRNLTPGLQWRGTTPSLSLAALHLSFLTKFRGHKWLKLFRPNSVLPRDVRWPKAINASCPPKLSAIPVFKFQWLDRYGVFHSLFLLSSMFTWCFSLRIPAICCWLGRNSAKNRYPNAISPFGNGFTLSWNWLANICVLHGWTSLFNYISLYFYFVFFSCYINSTSFLLFTQYDRRFCWP